MRWGKWGVVQLDTHEEVLRFLHDSGFPVNPHSRRVRGATAVLDYCAHWEAARHALKYATDGCSDQSEFVERPTHPWLRRAQPTLGHSPINIAPEQAETVISRDYHTGGTHGCADAGRRHGWSVAGRLGRQPAATLHTMRMKFAARIYAQAITFIIQKAGEVNSQR